MMRHIILFLVLLGLVAGCGHEPVQRSAVREEAIRLNQGAQEAFRLGDAATARDLTKRALDLYRALDDTDGVAMELINLSSAQLALGDTAGAIGTLEPFFANPGLEFPAAQRAEAAYRRAWIAHRASNAQDSESWLARAMTWCGGGCATTGRAQNLRAQLAFERGDLSAARDLGTEAKAASRKLGDLPEEANALRLLAEVAARDGDPAKAEGYFRQALALDKETGQAAKIHADLIGIGASLRAQKRDREALEHFERARSVAEGAGDEALTRSAETLIRDSVR